MSGQRRLDRVTDLFERWAAEESEHRTAGEYGIAEGLRVAIEELREAVHGDLPIATRDSDGGTGGGPTTTATPTMPACRNHRELQHRDGNPPWCRSCGWHRGRPATPALKIGDPS